MAASPSRSLEGIEVPMIGSDKVQWIELTVTSPPSESESSSATLSRNSASCHIIPGDPPAYLMWRIHNDRSNALEVVELSPCKEFPQCGLRLIFPDSLHPFAYICKNEIGSTEGSGYMLYALTNSGVAHIFRLRSPSTYISGSVFPQNDVEVFDLQKHSEIEKITAVTATFGCLATGRHDGSIGCYQLGTLDQNAPGFMRELRDDVGIGRLWTIMSRGRVVGAVQDLIICEIHGRKLLFALHSDGCLRVWDLLSHTRILNHIISVQELTGYSFTKFWVGNANYETGCISLAVLYRGSLDQDSDVIAVCRFHVFVGEKVNLSPESSFQSIPLEEGRLVDLKITSDKLWILKEDGSMLYDMFHCDVKMEHIRSYGLEEDFVAEQLFQGSEHPSDDMIWTNYSIFSSMKDQVAYFISSIFLRRLLQPGVHQGAALRATILDHKKYLTDYEFQSLTVSGLKKEIFSTIESGGVAPNPNALLCYWKSFCTHFFRHWCQNSAPYSLFMDSSTGAIGLIRKSSVSMFRCLEHIEMLIYGSSDELRDFRKSGLILPDNDLDCEILFDILRCMSNINHQLGRASAAVFYESLVNPLIISSEDVILQLLKTLETGYCSQMSTSLAFQVGVDTAWERKLADHKSQRKFSIDMLFSLHSLYAKATGWGRVLDVLEKYLKNLVPVKCIQNTGSQSFFNINSSLLIQATSQIARVMLESAFDVLLLLGYLINISAQVHLVQSELSHIKTKLLPMTQDILIQWLILHLLGTTPTESPTLDDFSSRLSSLHIDSKADNKTWDGKLGTPDFTLACLLDFPSSLADQSFLCSTSFPSPSKFIYSSRNLCNWIIWGWTREESPVFSRLTIELASILLQHGQYEAAENLFSITDTHLSRKKVYQSIQSINGEWCACLHLMGFCLLARAQNELHGVLKERKIREAVRCFFRAASGEGSMTLQNLSFRTGLPHPGDTVCATVWKFYYYQWAMQIFEQYNMSEGACQFALAALEQVDEVLGMNDLGADVLPEPAMTTKGRLWANVFKFNIDLNHYRDAYCAIISNPDEDSKFICLRRFIIVLCERGAAKVLCDGHIPFVGLMEKVEQELIWKAERSDILARPNLYKLLYAFEVRHNKWRKAASYMYRYSVRLRKEGNLNEHDTLSSSLQERLCALSTAINALHHVHPSHAWIDPQQESYFSHEQSSPNKRARKALIDNSSATIDPQSWRPQCYIDTDILEKEYVITTAQYVLSLVNDKPAFTGDRTLLVDVVDVLIQASFYDTAFTIILKFWKGSVLKRELERVFIAISQKCCLNTAASSVMRDHMRTHCLLLTSSENGTSNTGKFDAGTIIQQSRENGQWETLELYLDKYKKLHPRLPVTVAETLLHTDSQIELPLWLVHMFKGGRRATSWGMTGQELDPAALFRLYVNYGRYPEATNLLLEYLESFASLRPSDIVNRKKMSAVWFPYIAIERLWCQIEELRISGHMVDQCEKLKGLLNRALANHLKQVKVDSDDAIASFPR